MSRILAFIIILLMVSLAVTRQPTFSQNDTPPAFQLLILDASWGTLSMGYDPDPAFERLQEHLAMTQSPPLFVLELDDIASYHWNWQSITLTEAATQRLAENLPARHANPDVQRLIDLKESLGWGNPFESALYIQAFVVLVDGDFLYGGIFLDPMSQMAINYPVIRIEIVEGQAVFNILPTHIPFVSYDPVPRESTPLDEAYTPVMEGDHQQAPDFFDSAVDGWATSENSVYFRAFIRNERLFEVLEAAEKLTGEPEE
ncbi:MAG: hypothetical protein H6673_11220 [Anaerolineales bacterium]|nr:hypothetical protein [Anaerolineales bacterium]